MGLSQNAYSRHRKALGLPGGTLKATQKAIAAQRIHLEADGTIDPERADREWLENTGRPRGGTSTQEVTPPHRSTPLDRADQVGGEEEEEEGALGDMAHLPPMSRRGGQSKLTLIQAQTAKAEGEAHLKQLQVRRLEGELVDRERVQGFVFRLFRSERDAWMSWPARVDGQITGQLNALFAKNGGITQRDVNLILDGHVRQHLTELGKIDLEHVEADQEAA